MPSPDQNIIAISTIYRRINLWKNEQSRPLGLTAAQVPIIMLIYEKPGISQNNVAQELALEKSVVAKSIKKLMELGFLSRESNKEDKRAYNLFPLKKATEIYPVLIVQGKNCMELLTAGFREEEKIVLNQMLMSILDNTFTFMITNENEQRI